MIVKVCGMRDADNIRQVEQCGADWMGFIFFARSPRFVADEPEYLPPAQKRVGVFVNASYEEITDRVETFALDAVQLHGKETPELCSRLHADGLTVVKAFSLRSADDVTATDAYEGVCDYFLFDTPTAAYGGSGRRFDWALLQSYCGATPFLLSGGLSPDSLGDLATFSHPQWAGIDLNSGFETQPALKNPQTLKLFISKFRKQYEQNK